MSRELDYISLVNKEHRKAFGQYFTQEKVAEFMCKWACTGAKNILDPAVGNGVFLNAAKRIANKAILTGYEIDSVILDYFGNESGADIRNCDYLLSDWNEKYDAIICNPPYKRFQTVNNRKEIVAGILENTGIKYTSYTNLYILFLIKSLCQLADNGRLAYIIPTEFFNSKYGTPIKEKLLKEGLLKAVINFKNNDKVFYDATTTSCILLIDFSRKEDIFFYNLDSLSELDEVDFTRDSRLLKIISYRDISADEKWRNYINHEEKYGYRNLTDISEFCSISRGIATGANDFFCMSKAKARENSICDEALMECVCRSRDVKDLIFDRADFDELVSLNKKTYILDVDENSRALAESYIEKGEALGLNSRYILSRRRPWYSMEKKKPAPIWVCNANRNGIKFVRNLSKVNALTSFHSVYVRDEYRELTDIIFCYFITPLAQEIISDNCKEMGNGLKKFQPGDINMAKMLDIRLIFDEDRYKILNVYENMKRNKADIYIDELNAIFGRYLI